MSYPKTSIHSRRGDANQEPQVIEPTIQACVECGMPSTWEQYHPYAACLMFKTCHDSNIVMANLDAVHANGYQIATDEIAARLQQAEAVIVAAQAVIDRWDGLTWKDLEPTWDIINRLRDIIVQSKS